MKVLTQKQLLEMLKSGKAVRVGKWISGEAREFDWSDEKTGKAVTLRGITHDILFEKRVAAVAEEGDVTAEQVIDWKAPCALGSDVAVVVSRMGYVKGKGQVNRGEVYLLKGD